MRNHPLVLPDFLLPGIFDRTLKEIKTNVEEASSMQKFAPLMPLHISRRLIKNCYADIMTEPPLITLQSFLVLLDTQYATSTTNPAGDSAKWALVNAVVALAMRFKMAAGSEAEISPIIQGFYRNATSVIHQLIFGEPGFLSVQALLAMSMFARGIPDPQAFVMLVANASRLLQIARLKSGPVVALGEADQYEKVCEIIRQLDNVISIKLG